MAAKGSGMLVHFLLLLSSRCMGFHKILQQASTGGHIPDGDMRRRWSCMRKAIFSCFVISIITQIIILMSAPCNKEVVTGLSCKEMFFWNKIQNKQADGDQTKNNTKSNTSDVCFPNTCLLYGRRIDEVFLSIGLMMSSSSDTEIQSLLTTVDSLIANGDYLERNVFVIVIYMNQNASEKQRCAKLVYERYADLCEEGLIQIIHSPNKTYLELNGYTKSTGQHVLDLPLAKKNLDRSFLYLYSSSVSRYFIEIAVGEITIVHYGLRIKDFIEKTREYFNQIQFAGDGSTGILFPSKDAKSVAKLLYTFFDVLPTHRILQKYSKHRIIYNKKAVFHIKERIPKKSKEEIRHEIISSVLAEQSRNPAADIYTDMPTFEENFPQYAYDRDDFTYFWTSVIDIGSYFLVVFRAPQKISRIVVTTGNYINKDQLRTGTLRIGKLFSRITKDCDSIIQQWTFVDGMVDTNNDKNYSSFLGVNCLGIEVASRQHDWLMIRDIFIIP